MLLHQGDDTQRMPFEEFGTLPARMSCICLWFCLHGDIY